MQGRPALVTPAALTWITAYISIQGLQPSRSAGQRRCPYLDPRIETKTDRLSQRASVALAKRFYVFCSRTGTAVRRFGCRSEGSLVMACGRLNCQSYVTQITR